MKILNFFKKSQVSKKTDEVLLASGTEFEVTVTRSKCSEPVPAVICALIEEIISLKKRVEELEND
jgi:hypothetical protein